MDRVPAAFARKLEQLCIEFGDRAADDFGFVPIRALLNGFQAELIVRPLLVEAMLATVDAGEHGARRSRWAVLVDSDMHNLSDESILLEDCKDPLHARARNTIAHELAHSLAFRTSEFGLQLLVPGTGKAATDFVKAIERETERLSPFLLVTEKAFRLFSAEHPQGLSVEPIAHLRRKLGVSREVLVSRLQMLRSNDPTGLLERKVFRNVALGIAEWSENGAVIKNWPLFMNFDRNVVPDFLLHVRKRERTPASDLDISLLSTLRGGTERTTTFECEARVGGSVKPERMRVVLEVESSRRSGETSFYVVRGTTESVGPAPTDSIQRPKLTKAPFTL